MTTALTTPKYSFTRLKMLAGYYRSEFVRQLTVYGAIVVGMFILASIPHLEGLHFLEIFVLETLIALAPLPFSAERSRITNAMLPAKAGEKFSLLLFYSYIVVPVFIIGVWQLLYLCTMWSEYTYSIFNMTHLDATAQMFADNLKKPAIYIFNTLTNLSPMCSVMLVVLSARNSVIAKSLLAYIGTLIAFFIVGAIIGTWVTIRAIEQYGTQRAEEIANDFSTVGLPIAMTCAVVIGCISLAYVIFAFWRSYRKISRSQY